MADHRADLFFEVASIDYPILDADAHVNEPPDTWQARVPAKLRDRAPKVVHTDNGDLWSFDDGESRCGPVGLTATAGLSYLQYRPVGHHLRRRCARAASTPRPASPTWTPTASGSRCSTRASRSAGAKVYGADPELQLACVAAYNDWLAEFCEGSRRPARRPRRSCRRPASTTAIAETERAIALGHRGVVISAFPNGSLDAAPEDDALLGARAGRRHPGRGAHRQLPAEDVHGTAADVRHASRSWASRARRKAGSHTLPVVCDLIFSGHLRAVHRV